MTRPFNVAVALAAAWLAALPVASLAATDPPPAAGEERATQPKSADAQKTAVEREKLLRQLEEQRRLLQQQADRLERQQVLLDEQRGELERLREEIAALENRVRELEGKPAAPGAETAIVERLRALEDATKKNPELPPDVVSAGDFPGSVRIPGTETALKIGGQVRLVTVLTLDALNVDDRFETSAIPPEGSSGSEKKSRLNLSVEASRINFDVRSKTGAGTLRIFIEADFAGDGTTLHLRHAYGQSRRLLFGQTWSTFADPEAEPDGIDFEGLNAISLFRQPLVRLSLPLGERKRLALAIEDPKPEVRRRK